MTEVGPCILLFPFQGILPPLFLYLPTHLYEWLSIIIIKLQRVVKSRVIVPDTLQFSSAMPQQCRIYMYKITVMSE